MRVLILSLDQALLDRSGEGDTLLRFKQYSKYCTRFVSIVPTLNKTRKQKKGKVEILPARGFKMIEAYWRLFQMTSRFCRNKEIDLIVTNNPVLGAIAIWAKGNNPVKIQINIFGLESFNHYWLLERKQNILFKWVEDWAIRRADGLRTDNTKERNILIKHYGIDPQKIVVIPIAPSKKNQERFLKALGDVRLKEEIIGKNNKMILSVGSLVKAKDFPNLVAAAEIVTNKNPQVIFVIAGKGPERNKIEIEIEQKGLRDKIKLLDSVDYLKLPSLFTSADVFVLSSSHEGFPRVIMEAALSGKAIVTTAIDGAGELVENNRTGLIVPVKKPKLLAKAIIDLLKDKAKADRLGKEARKRARKLLDFETSVKKIIGSWEELLIKQK